MTVLVAPPSPEVKTQPAKIYSVGTLRYNQPQLVVLFFWLMWNDFSITLLEQVTSLNVVLFKDHGATNTQIALFASIGSLVMMVINPWCSTWSDRHRGRFGRRRPFLFFATPFFALFLMLIPFMPDVSRYLTRFPAAAAFLAYIPLNGPVFFIGVGVLISTLFNAMVMAIFSYLYWDVVPESLMGRFQSLGKIVTLVAGLIWSFFIFGLADHHMKAVYVGTAVFCLSVYLVSVWQTKEGEYPAPEPHPKGSGSAVRIYFAECFSQPYYLWVFGGHLAFQVANLGNNFQFFYLRYDLGLTLSTIGWSQGWAKVLTVTFGFLFGFAIGALTDRLKPVRLMAPTFILSSLTNIGAYFFVHDQWTYLWWFSLINFANFIFSIVLGAFTVEIFPREKLGQFCSAQFLFYQCALVLISPVTGVFFDYIKNNRLGFIWSAGFMALAAILSVKVYSNWRQRQGQTSSQELSVGLPSEQPQAPL